MKERIKELRALTGAGVGDVKAAAEALGGRGVSGRVAGRAAREGRVTAYTHHDHRSGCLLELNCESDFVANTLLFSDIAKTICLQIVAMSPGYVEQRDIPASFVNARIAKHLTETEQAGRAFSTVDAQDYVATKLAEWYAEVCLLDQLLVVNGQPGLTVRAWLAGHILATGENIVVRRFERFELGAHADMAPEGDV